MSNSRKIKKTIEQLAEWINSCETCEQLELMLQNIETFLVKGYPKENTAPAAWALQHQVYQRIYRLRHQLNQAKEAEAQQVPTIFVYQQKTPVSWQLPQPRHHLR